MTQKATALIKFKHCDFGEHFAEATAAYDADPQTAWIAPFTVAQKNYWQQQPIIDAPNWLTTALLNHGISFDSLSGRAFNQYADDLATQRNTAIYGAAQSAYTACMAEGLPTPTVQTDEPGFKLVVQTKLEGGAVSGGTAPNTGVSAQINVLFAPANPANAVSRLDWKPFYRLGPILWAVCDPSLWTMELAWNFYSNFPVQLTTPSSGLLIISLPWFTTISADIVQYLSVPEGYALSDPGNLNANFSALVSSLDVIVTRHVYLPDGTYLRYTVRYSDGVTAGGIDSKTLYVDFPPFAANCEESGWVEIYYVIELYTVATIYELNSDIEKTVDANGVVHPRRVLAGIEEYSGSSIYPPTGFNSVMESYFFLKLNLGAVVITIDSHEPIVYLFHIGDRPVINSNISLVFSRNYYLDNVLSYLPVSTYGPAELSFPLNVFLGGASNSIMLDIPIVERVSLVYVVPDPDEGIIGGHFLESAPTAHVFNSPSSDPFKIQVTGHDLLIRVTSSSNTSAPGGMTPLPDFRIL
jgi:hypothetical protein